MKGLITLLCIMGMFLFTNALPGLMRSTPGIGIDGEDKNLEIAQGEPISFVQVRVTKCPCRNKLRQTQSEKECDC